MTYTKWPAMPNNVGNAAEQLGLILQRSHPGVIMVYEQVDDSGEVIVVSVRSPAGVPIPRGIPSTFAGYRVIVCTGVDIVPHR